MTIRIIYLLSVFACACLTSSAQDLSDLIFGKGNKNTYIGQYNYNGKRKNGFGIERYKNGAIYIGDFVENEVSGRGMLISQKNGISNVENAVVYVGIWREGKKNGRGICYDMSGRVVFKGKFLNDKPLETSSEDFGNMHFTIKDVGKDLYLGEMLGDVSDGFGLTLQEDGKIVFGTIKNNLRQGIGMVFYSSKTWEVGRWANGRFSAFNNSQTAKAGVESFRASNMEMNKWMRNSLLEAVGNFAQVSTQDVNDPVEKNTLTSDHRNGEANVAHNEAFLQDITSMQKRINYIDSRLEEIGKEQATLAKDRDNAKSNIHSASGTALKPISQSNIAKNATPSRTRQRAKSVSKAQTPYRNQLSNIETQVQKLRDEKTSLIAERNELVKKIDELQGRTEETAISSKNIQSSSDNKGNSDNKLKESQWAKDNIRSYQTRMDVILKELSDRKSKPDFYYDGGESVEDYRKIVKSLQKKAKDLIQDWYQHTGDKNFPTDRSLVYEWNP